MSLLRDLLFEADPDADVREPMSALLLTVWADQFDGVNVWGSKTSLNFILAASPQYCSLFLGMGLCFVSWNELLFSWFVGMELMVVTPSLAKIFRAVADAIKTENGVVNEMNEIEEMAF